jgi:hypothetical protein
MIVKLEIDTSILLPLRHEKKELGGNFQVLLNRTCTGERTAASVMKGSEVLFPKYLS